MALISRLITQLKYMNNCERNRNGSIFVPWKRMMVLKVIQKSNEPYIEFLARLKQTIERTVIGEKARKQLLKMPTL